MLCRISQLVERLACKWERQVWSLYWVHVFSDPATSIIFILFSVLQSDEDDKSSAPSSQRKTARGIVEAFIFLFLHFKSTALWCAFWYWPLYGKDILEQSIKHWHPKMVFSFSRTWLRFYLKKKINKTNLCYSISIITTPHLFYMTFLTHLHVYILILLDIQSEFLALLMNLMMKIK